MNSSSHSQPSISNPDFLLRCLELAQKGIGFVSPNPMVGAVLVFEDKIIGEGWHEKYGEAHAEVNCIRSVSEENKRLISKSTLFVSLEPCAHFGKTPPCADLIIQNKIPKVVIGCTDPFSKVSGKGIERLKDAGIEVVIPVLEKECRLMNRRFFTVQEKKRPYVILKWAQSEDGYLAPFDGAKTQLSNESSTKLVHKMRHEEDAVLIGFKTALNDDPRLNNRLWKSNSKQPIRIVLDLERELPLHLKVFDNSQKTIILNFISDEVSENNQWVKINRELPIVLQIFEHLRDIQSLIIEGGSKTLQSFIDADLWDEAYLFKTPISLGNGISAPLLKHGKNIQNFNLDKDIVSLQINEHNSFYL